MWHLAKSEKSPRSKSKNSPLSSEQIVGSKKKIQSGKGSQKGPVQIVVSLAKQRVSIYKGGKVIAYGQGFYRPLRPSDTRWCV